MCEIYSVSILNSGALLSSYLFYFFYYEYPLRKLQFVSTPMTIVKAQLNFSIYQNSSFTN